MNGDVKGALSIRIAVFALLAVAFILALSGCAVASTPAQPVVAVLISGTPTTAPTVPPPVGTIEPPTTTPAPILPTGTPAPLPRPPQATSLPIGTLTPGTPTPAAKAAGSSDINMAWGVATDNDLTIWVGTYSDTPSPSISNSRAIVKWAVPLTLLDLAISPDHQSLAVFTGSATASGEGDVSGWLSVINLTDNSVQGIPDYNNHSDLYSYYYIRPPNKILGWIDNSTFAVQQSIEGVVSAGKDGASYSLISFPQGGYQGTLAIDSALSADRTTVFSELSGNESGFWLYNIDGSNPKQLVDGTTAKQAYSPNWSPDAKYISFLSPQLATPESGGVTGTTDQYIGLWLLDLGAKSQNAVSGGSTWDVDPAWSSDSSKIAFLRSDSPISEDDIWSRPDKVSTNIFVASVSDLTPHQLTQFQATNNSDLQWTDGGNLIMASTAGSNGPPPGIGLPNIIAVSGQGGSTTTLVQAGSGQSLEHPQILK
jgi:hypothetical protein